MPPVADEARATSAAAGNMPLFYKRPRPLNAAVHRGLSLMPTSDFGFARSTNSVVLGATEFPLAMRHYPIVFTAGEPRVPVAVLGLEAAHNLYVAKDGKWLAEGYVPAYVRRYPFLFLEQPGKEELVLCIDEDSGLLVRSEERPLFSDQGPTQLVQDALKFCRDFQQATRAGAAFAAALAERGLLIPNRARVVLNSGKEMVLRDFDVVDEAKFNALPDDVFLDWRRRGWLVLVYCHLLSMGSWAKLVELAAGQQ